MKYDYLIVGAGLSGAVFAERMTSIGKKCLVIDKRNHVAGNIYTENVDGIDVHKYGAHIFHTSNETVWNYVNKFTKFLPYIHSPLANYRGEIYNLPFNMNTFVKMWGDISEAEVKSKIAEQIKESGIKEVTNLEEQAITLVGSDIYRKLIKEYTEKQWGRPCTELPSFIIKRLPVRYTFDNNYFNDSYQGIPEDNYTTMVENMLKGVEVLLNTDYFTFINNTELKFDKVVYSGTIDRFFDYEFGELEYRSLDFVTKKIDTEYFQTASVVNYTGHDVDYTRIIEHKHFKPTSTENTIVSYEYSKTWNKGDEEYYPVNNEENSERFKKYSELAEKRKDVIFVGRLGLYEYLDMDKVIGRTLSAIDELF